MNQLNITKKSDWLNDWLSNEGFFVSDHDKFSSLLKLNDNYKISLRFFGNKYAKYHYSLIVKAAPSEWSNFFTDTTDQFISKLEYLLKDKISIIFYSEESSDLFGVRYENKIVSCTAERLSSYFTFLNPKFTQNAGGNKRINKSLNDSFQLWTKQYLSKFISCNDIDAFSLLENKILMLELKRPKQNVQKWMPYVDDYSNYSSGIIMETNNPLIEFTTVSYNENQSNCVGIYKINHASKEKIMGINRLKSVSSMKVNDFISLEDIEYKEFESTRTLR
jgi:hypothetical protein